MGRTRLEQVAQMQSFGHARRIHTRRLRHPGVRATVFLPACHTASSRLYEPFGHGVRIQKSASLNTRGVFAATWYRGFHHAIVNWSQRDTTHYEQTDSARTKIFVLLAAHPISSRTTMPKANADREGPRWKGRLRSDPARSRADQPHGELCGLQRQHVEIQQLTSSATSSIPAKSDRQVPRPDLRRRQLLSAWITYSRDC